MDWLREDALLLRDAGRLRGCICLLLCLVDAQSHAANPGESKNRARFCDYLEQRLRRVGIDRSIRVDAKDRLYHWSELIYEYFRCNLVHEGDARDNLQYDVQIEYEPSGRFWTDAAVLGDRINHQIVFRADALIEILLLATEPGEV